MQDSSNFTGKPLRAPDGKLLPGGPSLNPAGRKPKAYEKALITALSEAFPAEKMIALYNEALELAREHKSPRAIAGILSDISDRIAGKPGASVALTGDAGADVLALMQLDASPLWIEANEKEAQINVGV